MGVGTSVTLSGAEETSLASGPRGGVVWPVGDAGTAMARLWSSRTENRCSSLGPWGCHVPIRMIRYCVYLYVEFEHVYADV